MALRRTLSQRLSRHTNLPITTVRKTSTAAHPHPNAAKPNFDRQFSPAPVSAAGIFRRFLQRRGINNHSSPNFPSFLTFPVGEKLREKLKSMNTTGDERLRLDGFRPPLPPAPEEEGLRIGAADAKRVLRFVQMEQIRAKLRNIPASTIPYGDFVQLCSDVCGNREMGTDFAKAFDASGNVIVLGDVVFLRPDQVAKSMENLISQSIAMPNDPRRKELENLEKEKALIDRKARSIVQGELYCGLGFLVLQTLGFMRLTFWELSWDVMEPICFFVTSLHFALAYAFFLRTSNEPSFEGYFQRRFKVKQKKLMKTHNFDLERYNELREVFYPNNHERWGNKSVGELKDNVKGTIFSPVHD